MEQYVYFSIIFFSMIIISLYIYIMFEKILEAYRKKKVRKYSGKLDSYLESTIDKIEKGEDVELIILNNLKQACKNKAKREIIAGRLVNYLENSKCDFIPKIIYICEYIGVVDYEIKKLTDKNKFKKALAAKWLGEFRSKKAIPALLKELDIDNNDVKYNILLALAKIGDEDVFIKVFENINSLVILSERSLIEIVDSFEGDKIKVYKHMINSNNHFIASVFIKSAGNYKEMSLSEDISKYLYSKDKEMRIAAVKAIGNMGDKKHLDDILRLIEDPEWEVRAVTAKALSNFSEEKILIPLSKALSDSQWYVRYNAATSILKQKESTSVLSYVFEGKDRFAKDIVIAALENSENNNLYLYEISEDPVKKKLAVKIKEYLDMKKQVVEL